MRLSTFVATAALALCAGAEGTAPAADRALLVGCTKYPYLDLRFELEGPAQDVRLMKRLLVDRFGTDPSNIVALWEEATTAELLPTRANIEREFRRLAEVSGPGDQVVVLLAGHGSQQPDDDPDNPDDYEPDGMDEIFLPRDVKGWDGSQGTVVNAIVDDELRVWLNDIRRTGAFVWVIVDACHSGTMVRGGAREVLRQVRPAALEIPAEAIREARRRAVAVAPPEGAPPAAGLVRTADPLPGGMVAIYASQSHEPTVERELPPDAAQREVYGLLSYTINEVLTQATAPLTYRELAERVHRQYVAWGRAFPTPMVEGTDVDQEVLRQTSWPEPLPWRLTRHHAEGWQVDAGALHGLTAGSILSVHPPAGEGEPDELLGYVQVTFAGVLESRAKAIAHDDEPLRDDFPDHARCRLHVQDFGDLRLPVAVAPGGSEQPAAATGEEALAALLRELAGEPGSLVAFAEAAERAEWLVHAGRENIYLAPASGWLVDAAEPGAAPPPGRFVAARPGDDMRYALRNALRTVARARNLLTIVHRTPGDAEGWIDVEVEILRETGDEIRTVAPEGPEHFPTLTVGQRVGFRVHNPGRLPADVTLLYIDANHGIHPVFPQPGEVVDNQVRPGRSLPPLWATVTRPVGLEQMVAIAVRSDLVHRTDFSYLAQPGLERARGDLERTRGANGAEQALESPLGKLLRNALFADGTTRGLGLETSHRRPGDGPAHAIRSINWRVVEAPPEPEDP